jgi:bifunctional ADP-heptose synthase (sugar kinase/adenylyltransferase)
MKILVIGDSCIDEFVYGSTPRLSPEGPAPVFNPEYTTTNPGMAGNVKRNLEKLGADVDLFTNLELIKKTRYVEKASNTLLLRVDIQDQVPRIPKKQLKSIEFSEYDSIIISDYNKGFLMEDDIEYISRNHSNVVCDTKKKLGEWCKSLKYIKLNRIEYTTNLVFINTNSWIKDKIIATLDKDGCMYRDVLFKSHEVDIIDISGAGDTFTAAFTYSLTSGSTVEYAILFANSSAEKVVQKRGVSVF